MARRTNTTIQNAWADSKASPRLRDSKKDISRVKHSKPEAPSLDDIASFPGFSVQQPPGRSKDSSSMTHPSLPQDTNNVWVTVNRKKKPLTTTPVPITKLPEQTVEPNNFPVKTDEEKKASRARRKAVLKEKKMHIREDKAKKEREQQRKDTKVSVISQEAVDSFYNRQKPDPPRLFTMSSETTAPLVYSRDIPAPESTGAWNRTRVKGFLSESIPQSSVASTRKKSSTKPTSSPDVSQNTKKKVKSKDLIQFDMRLLIKEKKAPKPIVPLKRLKERKVAPKKGKTREVPKVKVSTLKKQIKKEKETRTSNFSTYLIELQEATQKSTPQSSLDSLASTVVASSESAKEAETSDQKSSLDEIVTEEPCSNGPDPSLTDDQLNDELAKLNLKDGPAITPTFGDSLRQDLLKEIKNISKTIHTKKFREYCDHVITPEILATSTEFIEMIVKFQRRLYEKDPIKGRSRRRYYCGMRECRRHMKKFVCLFVAPDLDYLNSVDNVLGQLLQLASECKVPVIYAMGQHRLARLTFRKCGVSCMGITNHQGAQDVYNSLSLLVAEAKPEYERRTGQTTLSNEPEIFNTKLVDILTKE